MNQSLTSYPDYKPAGLPWLDEVPAHWEIKRARTLFQKMDRPVRDFDNVVTCFRDGMVTLRKNRRVRGFTEAMKEHGYQGIRVGDLVIHGMDAFAGAIGVSDSDGKGTPVYIVCQPKQELIPAYFAYVIREMSRNQFILSLAKGIRERSTDFRYENLAALNMPFPSLPEQQCIVAFLDAKGRQITGLVRHKRQLIKLLNEQKQALVHRAVTQGINPNAPRKDSGVAWLGKVPAHWEVKRTKYFYQEVDTRSTTGLETHLSMSQKFGLVPNSTLDTKRLLSESYVGGKLCRKDDLVLNRLKAHLGVFALANEPGLISPDYTVLRATQPLCHKYFEFVLKTPACRVEFRIRTKGIVEGFWRLYTDDFYNIKLPFPPADEQQEIVQHIEKDFQLIDQTISRAQREIELIQEYRTRLVADVVTGRVDVRHLANEVTEALLPDEIELEDEEEESEQELAEAEAESD